MNSSFYSEREEIAALLEAVMHRHLAEAGIPSVNDIYEEVFDEMAIGKYPERREMRFYLGDLAAFTPALANRLRTEVLSRFKKWTVVPQYEERAFTVSAGTVSFGTTKIRSSITTATEAYRRWLRATRRYDEKRTGPLRRQFRYLTPLIPAAVSVVRVKRVVVLASFDTFVPPCWEGHPVVWVLTEGGKEPPEIRPGYSGNRQHAVTAKGIVEPQYCRKYWPATDEPTPFFLYAHEFSWRNRRRLELAFQDGATPIQINELLRDADLKVQQRRTKRHT